MKKWMLCLMLASSLIVVGCSEGESKSATIPAIGTGDVLNIALANAGDKLVVIDLYADWCGPCRVIAPYLEKLYGKHKSNVDFYRVNIDNARDIATKYNASSIPLVVFVKNGQVVDQLLGAHPMEAYQEMVVKHASGAAPAAQ